MNSHNQPSKSTKTQKLSGRARLIAAVIFLVIAAGAVLLWASGKGYLDLGPILGKCGFKQRFGLPCPGCGWTHAGQVFFSGHIIKSFMIQPAAGFFCVVAVVTALFALHCAVFGIDFGFLRYLSHSAGLTILLLSTIAIILAGWVVTLVRTILENSG